MRRWFLFQFSAIASTGDRRRPHQTTGAIRGLKRSLKTDGRGSAVPPTKQQADDSSATQRGGRRSRRTPSEAPNGLRRDTQGSGLCWPESERARERGRMCRRYGAASSSRQPLYPIPKAKQETVREKSNHRPLLPVAMSITVNLAFNEKRFLINITEHSLKPFTGIGRNTSQGSAHYGSLRSDVYGGCGCVGDDCRGRYGRRWAGGHGLLRLGSGGKRTLWFRVFFKRRRSSSSKGESEAQTNFLRAHKLLIPSCSLGPKGQWV